MTSQRPSILFLGDDLKEIESLHQSTSETEIFQKFDTFVHTDKNEGFRFICENRIDLVILYVKSGLSIITKYLELIFAYQKKQVFFQPEVYVVTTREEEMDVRKILTSGIAETIGAPLCHDSLGFKLQLCLNRIKIKNLIRELDTDRTAIFKAMSHDVANLLNVSILNLNRYKSKPDDSLIDKSINGQHSIAQMVKKLAEVVSNEKPNLTLKKTNIDHVINQAVNLYRERISEKNISLKVNHSGGVYVLAEKVSLTYQVLGNLIENAIKFTPEEGIISIEAVNFNNQFVILRISDNGIGIPEKIKEVIFDWNSHSHREGTKGERGTGFGLPIVKKFIEKMEGEIKITSPLYISNNEGFGTSFEIKLKVYE